MKILNNKTLKAGVVSLVVLLSGCEAVMLHHILNNYGKKCIIPQNVYMRNGVYYSVNGNTNLNVNDFCDFYYENVYLTERNTKKPAPGCHWKYPNDNDNPEVICP